MSLEPRCHQQCTLVGNFTGLLSLLWRRICFLGDRLLAQASIWNDTTKQMECHKRPGGPIYRMYCGNVTEEQRQKGSDPDCAYMMAHNATLTPGIPGINLELFKGLL